jgi:hypothetical protein
MNWISINEKYPESRKKVLVCFEDEYGKRHIMIAEHINEKEVLEEDYLNEKSMNTVFAEYDVAKNCYWTPTGWYENQYVPDQNRYLEEKVTHWAYLPELPDLDNCRLSVESFNDTI